MRASVEKVADAVRQPSAYRDGDRGVVLIRLQVAGNVAPLRAVGLASLLVLEAELDRVIAVAILIADLQDGAGADLQYRDRLNLAGVVVNLRHSHFQTEQPQRHRRTLSFQPAEREASPGRKECRIRRFTQDVQGTCVRGSRCAGGPR